MATNIGDFFIMSNSVYNITDEDYQKINLLVNTAKAFARSTHQCVYIIDYFKQNFLYVSENLGYWGSPDKPGGLSIQLCKSEKKEFYIRYSS
ncbi:hypothetical protein [Phocaeicola vulgatus]|uniref:hypothetical protein n=1 Tax=Phocaeicola vulgatus TaxID=821 RepID=UPI001922DDA2|nr:hypothetical protein [Phocaeicola vulgatus]MDC1602420.1 hypothetical protein [Phocaeicola vulgatus]